MKIFTKRNALLGWIVYLVARRRIEKRVASGGHRVRNGILAGVGVAAGAGAAVALWARRGHTGPAQARA